MGTEAALDTETILKGVEGLPDGFEVEVQEDAWYSTRSVYRLLGKVPEGTEFPPPVRCVRVHLKQGMLELHPAPEGKVQIKCYCCFEGNPDRGSYDLAHLKDAVVSLKDHYCPPWPG